MPLRGYQEADLAAVETALAGGDRPTGKGQVNRVAVEWATGLGKTVLFSHWALRQPKRKVVLVNRDELARQARDKIHSVSPRTRVGIVMGSMNEVEADIVIASVQTLGPGLLRAEKGNPPRRLRADAIRGVGAIVVDEAHHSAAPTWRATLRYLGAYDGVPTLGVSATLNRDDQYGLGEVWEECAAKRDVLWGIRNGVLCDVRGIRVQVPGLNLAGVHISAGDLQQNEVAELMLDANTGGAIAKAVLEFAPNGRGPVFSPNVAAAHDFAEALNAVGQPAEVVIGTTPVGIRQEIYERLRTGVTRWICTVGVLTEGWDAPWADTAIIARPTKSSGLYRQMLGRVLRMFPAGGKTEALVLDVVGVSTRHTLASMVDLGPDRPVKERQSILEAWDEEDLVSEAYDRINDTPGRVERVIGTDVDLKADLQPTPWLQTRAGTWFILAGDLLFFVWPEMETMNALTAPVRVHTGLVTVGVTSAERFERSTPLRTGLIFEAGMTWAEALAAEHRKPPTAKWRARPPSNELVRQAQRRGLPSNPSFMDQGGFYDMVAVAIGTERLDG